MTPRHGALAVALSLALGAPVACAQPAPSPAPDVSPWMASLRPAVRAELSSSTSPVTVARLPVYDLALRYEPATRTYTLRETLSFTNTERAPMADVVLRLYGNATPAATAPGATPPIRVVRSACEGDGCTVRAAGASVLVARPRTPLAPGARLRIDVELSGTLTEIDSARTNILAQGMESLSSLGSEGAGDYGLLATGEGIASFANFFAVLARREGGRWARDDHGTNGDLGSDDLANWHAVIDAPASWTVASSGVTLGRTTAGDRARTEVGAVAVRDVAVVMGAALQTETRRVGEVEVRSVFLPGDREAGRRVLDAAAGALEVFERRFGAYPFTELDVVEAPLVGGAGGVEFSGLVTVASMFYHPPQMSGVMGGVANLLGVGDAITQQMGAMLPAMLEFVTAHEVAHQYWHGLVGSDSRVHPFVDESLAQWSAALYLEDRYGAERARRDADMNVRMNYQLMRQLGHDDGPVDRPASFYGPTVRYAGIVYGKGPYYYNALREAAGDAVFFRAMRRYVNAWRFRTAPPSGFVDALVAEHGAGAARYRGLARRWLQESHGDDDLGRADMGAMLGSMMGGDAPSSEEMQRAMETLGPLLQQLTGGDGNGLFDPNAGTHPTQRRNGANGGANRPSQGTGDPDMDRVIREMQGL